MALLQLAAVYGVVLLWLLLLLSSHLLSMHMHVETHSCVLPISLM